MAVVNPVITYPDGDMNSILYTWTLTTANPKGTGFKAPQHRDRTWHAIGGAGWGTATAAVQGANTDTDAEYAAVKDPSGSAITWTADGSPKSQVEGSMYSRPNLTAVGVGATVVVTCLAVRNQKRTS